MPPETLSMTMLPFLSPKQVGFDSEKSYSMPGITVIEAEELHPKSLVTVTSNMPAESVVMEGVISPVDHWYELWIPAAIPTSEEVQKSFSATNSNCGEGFIFNERHEVESHPPGNSKTKQTKVSLK